MDILLQKFKVIVKEILFFKDFVDEDDNLF